jgi:hypothetical protein
MRLVHWRFLISIPYSTWSYRPFSRLRADCWLSIIAMNCQERKTEILVCHSGSWNYSVWTCSPSTHSRLRSWFVRTFLKLDLGSHRYIGGPGGGTDASDRTFFNPDKYKVLIQVPNSLNQELTCSRSSCLTSAVQGNRLRKSIAYLSPI